MRRQRYPFYQNTMISSAMKAAVRLWEIPLSWCQRALARLLGSQLFDIPWENTVVFGDSNNDLAMFEYAATKVAMGNASPKIKELADYVTSDMFHYGIRDGLKYLKLI